MQLILRNISLTSQYLQILILTIFEIHKSYIFLIVVLATLYDSDVAVLDLLRASPITLELFSRANYWLIYIIYLNL